MTTTPFGQVVTVASYEIRKYIRGRRLLGMLILVALIIGLEHEKRTGYFLFPNPVRREVLVVGKIAASLIVSAAVLTLYYGAAAIAALAITGSLTWDVGLSYVYALAYMTAVVGVAYLLSALLKSTVAATVLTFFLFTLIFTIIGAILSVASVKPWFIPTSASGIIANALGGAAVGPGPGGGAREFVPDPATSVLVFAAYAIVGGVLAILWFRRRELAS
ncbi:MAG: ABC transporter permease [Methanobacteriota archaeon]|nr:MAG: ABC transporter permease [Euryarchaeota archaeon]